MKINSLFILFIVIGCILAAGYLVKSIPLATAVKPNLPDVAPGKNSTLTNQTNATKLNLGSGQIVVSIGNYNDELPVFVDTTLSGNVTNNKPLNFLLSEGPHTIRVCSGTVCEVVDVEIKSSIKTTINFEERLKMDAPQGSVSISSGNYPETLPVFIDNIKAGEVTRGKVLNQTLSTGIHTLRICPNETCLDETIEIKPLLTTTVNLEGQLRNDISEGPLSITIGGYNADLPVLIDGIKVGNVSGGKPLNLKIEEGNHTVKVCVGNICETEEVQVKFFRQSVVDFGERLKKDAEFPTPTARIRQSSLTGNTLFVDVEFINPDISTHTITATLSCVYTFTDSGNVRVSDSERDDISRSVGPGARITQQFSLSLTGGSNVIANEPVLVNMTVK
jgi:hypothetical protein